MAKSLITPSKLSRMLSYSSTNSSNPPPKISKSIKPFKMTPIQPVTNPAIAKPFAPLDNVIIAKTTAQTAKIIGAPNTQQQVIEIIPKTIAAMPNP